jgi:hypothetical protein
VTVAAAAPKPPPESALLTQVRQLAKMHGVLCYHTHDSRRSDPGFPDVVLAGPGGVAFLELKRAKGGRVSKAQREWLDTLTASGQDARIVKPGDLPEVTRLIHRLRRPQAAAA